jgi:hypothetical protein
MGLHFHVESAKSGLTYLFIDRDEKLHGNLKNITFSNQIITCIH